MAIEQPDRAGVAVDQDQLTAADPPGRDGGAEHGRNAVLPRHDRAVAERTSNVGDDARGHGEQRSPCRCRDAGHQHIAGLHQAEVLGSAEDSSRRSDGSGTRPGALDQVAGLVLRRRRHPVAEHVAPAALGQQLRRRRPPLPTPHLLAFLHLLSEAAEPFIDFRATQPEDILRFVDHACPLEPSTDLGEHAAHLRPGQADVGQRILANRRRSLRPVQQPAEGFDAYWIQPCQYGGRRLFPAGRGALLPPVRIDTLATDEEPHGLQQRNRIIGRHRIHEVQVVCPYAARWAWKRVCHSCQTGSSDPAASSRNFCGGNESSGSASSG